RPPHGVDLLLQCPQLGAQIVIGGLERIYLLAVLPALQILNPVLIVVRGLEFLYGLDEDRREVPIGDALGGYVVMGRRDHFGHNLLGFLRDEPQFAASLPMFLLHFPLERHGAQTHHCIKAIVEGTHVSLEAHIRGVDVGASASDLPGYMEFVGWRSRPDADVAVRIDRQAVRDALIGGTRARHAPDAEPSCIVGIEYDPLQAPGAERVARRSRLAAQANKGLTAARGVTQRAAVPDLVRVAPFKAIACSAAPGADQ